jgi:Zn-dependent peptidase ImmA (M78 family)
VRPRPQIDPFQAQFGRFQQENVEIGPSIDRFEELARNYLELEQIAGAPFVRKYPQQYEIANLRTEQAAESVAIEERHRLGLGDGAIAALRDILEQDVGFRIFYLPLPSWKLSALYLYDEQLGGCIALNSQHSEEQRLWSLARVYGHFLTNRLQPAILIEDRYQRQPVGSRFADDFALSFLMPTSGLTRRIHDILRTKATIASTDLSILAHYYGVSVATIALRLERMKLLSTDSWNRLRTGGTKVREAQQQLELETPRARDEKLPLRYQYLALDVFDRGLITEEHFARFLEVDRVEARRIVEELREQSSGAMDNTTIDSSIFRSHGA